MSETPSPLYQAPPPSGGPKIPILFGAVLALIASNVYLFLQIDKTKDEIVKTREAFSEEISTVRQSSSVSLATSKKQMGLVIKAVQAKAAGRADGKTVSTLVGEMLPA